MVTTLGPYTAADLLRMREETDERLELIDGEVFVVPSPNEGHQTSSSILVHAFVGQITLKGLGRVYHAPFDVLISDDRVVQPDLLVVLNEDRAAVGPDGVVGRPSLVVEIVSPTNRMHDLRRKRALYADAGIPEFWLVDPALRSVVVLTEPSAGDYRTERVYTERAVVRSVTIPVVEIAVTDLFPPPFKSA
jgi:Uma2 family endonuclease